MIVQSLYKMPRGMYITEVCKDEKRRQKRENSRGCIRK